MKKTILALALVMILGAVGCVIRTEHTINAHVTLDIRHIATQAGNVLDYVEGKSDALPGIEAPPPDTAAQPGPQSWLRQAVESMSPVQVAYADALKVTTSPTITEIAAKMRARNPQIDALKKSICIGESNRGYVEVKDCPDLQDAAKRNDAQKLIAEENKDRKALYNEVARLNSDQGVSVSTVESIYAMERLRRAASGAIFQLPSAGNDFDTIKGSPMGQKLGARCIPDAWVTIP